MGIVAASAHHSGKATSATIPRRTNTTQKIFRCIASFYRAALPTSVIPVGLCFACIAVSSQLPFGPDLLLRYGATPTEFCLL
jgi:hypothetical protein